MTGPKSPERGASPLSGEKFETVPKLKGTGEEEEKELRGATTDRPTDRPYSQEDLSSTPARVVL